MAARDSVESAVELLNAGVELDRQLADARAKHILTCKESVTAAKRVSHLESVLRQEQRDLGRIAHRLRVGAQMARYQQQLSGTEEEDEWSLFSVFDRSEKKKLVHTVSRLEGQIRDFLDDTSAFLSDSSALVDVGSASERSTGSFFAQVLVDSVPDEASVSQMSTGSGATTPQRQRQSATQDELRSVAELFQSFAVPSSIPEDGGHDYSPPDTSFQQGIHYDAPSPRVVARQLVVCPRQISDLARLQDAVMTDTLFHNFLTSCLPSPGASSHRYAIPAFRPPVLDVSVSKTRPLLIYDMPFSVKYASPLFDVLSHASTLSTESAGEHLTSTAILLIARDIAIHLTELHSSQIVHGSVNTQHVVLYDCSNRYIVARMVHGGTLRKLPEDMDDDDKERELKADVLGLGLTFAALAHRKPIPSRSAITANASPDTLRALPHHPDDMDPPYESFVELTVQCLAEDPDLRPSMQEALEWLESVVEEEDLLHDVGNFADRRQRLMTPEMCEEEMKARIELLSFVAGTTTST